MKNVIGNTAASEVTHAAVKPRWCRRFAAAAIGAMMVTASAVSAQQPNLIVVTGVAGEPQYTKRFHQWATGLIDAMKLPATKVHYLAEKPETTARRATGKSTRDEVAAVIRTVAAKSQDPILLVLIGHGSGEGEPRFNLVGPDLTATELNRMLDAIGDRRVAVINAASASGAFLEPLSAPGRIIVTATRSGLERNETIFAQHLVEAFQAGDADKDGRISLLEAFNYARSEVDRWYREQNRLVTEHAMLEDNGDGKGSMEPDGRTDGAIARTFYLAGAAAVTATTDPRLRTLYAEKQALEEKIETLKSMKAGMEEAVYERELEKLLIDLSLKNQEIRKLEGGR